VAGGVGGGCCYMNSGTSVLIYHVPILSVGRTELMIILISTKYIILQSSKVSRHSWQK